MREDNKSKFEPKFIVKDRRSSGRSSSGSSESEYSRGGNIASLLSNIEDGVTPFQKSSNNTLDVRDAIRLCQKAYWNVSIFRLTVDIMTEFANSPIHFNGENKSAVKFFQEWYKYINGWGFAEQFFRELFRSSNVFVYKMKGRILDDPELSSKNQSKKSLDNLIPLRYVIMNPVDIKCDSTPSFIEGSYKKILNPYEIEVLRNAKDEKTQELVRNLPAETRKDLALKSSREVSIELTPENFSAVFYKKQDYEPFAVPMYFPVLFDINLKIELKKAEQVVARTADYMILLITMGDKENGVDGDLMTSMQTLFGSESVGRVMISDYTTKMEFIIPELSKILGPEKYISVNQDIANGLMNIFFNEEKFADSMIKIKVFLERLKEARKKYLNDFLIPQMKDICSILGFRECPEPKFEEIDLREEVEYMKIYNRLAELGFLTAEETLFAHKTHQLPEPYDSVISQEKFKKQKEDGLYAAIGSGGKEDAIAKPAGRPTGTPQKQKQKKVTPVGASKNYSTDKMKSVISSADELIDIVTEEYKLFNKIKRISKAHKEIAKKITWSIIQNEKMNKWKDRAKDYVKNPLKEFGEISDDVAETAEEHSLDFLSAALLFHSKLD